MLTRGKFPWGCGSKHNFSEEAKGAEASRLRLCRRCDAATRQRRCDAIGAATLRGRIGAAMLLALRRCDTATLRSRHDAARLLALRRFLLI